MTFSDDYQGWISLGVDEECNDACIHVTGEAGEPVAEITEEQRDANTALLRKLGLDDE